MKSLQPDCLLLNIGCTDSLDHTDVIFFKNSDRQEVNKGFKGPGVLCQKLTGTWYWRQKDAVTPPRSCDYALGLMDELFPINVNLMLNLTPNTDGRIDDNLAAEYAKMGSKLNIPMPLEEIPERWLERK